MNGQRREARGRDHDWLPVDPVILAARLAVPHPYRAAAKHRAWCAARIARAIEREREYEVLRLAGRLHTDDGGPCPACAERAQ